LTSTPCWAHMDEPTSFISGGERLVHIG
jgi:hypothetical protein